MVHRRLVCPSFNVIAWADYSLPDRPGDRQVLVRNTHGAEKHGTMQAFVRKHANARGAWDARRGMHTPGQGMVWSYPIPLGNMQVGVVERTGATVTRYQTGDRVAYHGGFQPYALIDESVGWKLGPDTSWKSATCLDPAAYALCALRDGAVRVGDGVAVFSLGAIGLMAVALARLSGAHPILALDPVESRRRIAQDLGADSVLDPLADPDPGARLRELTGWKGVDVVIEYSGTLPAMQAALRGVAFGGTIVAGGFPGPWPAGLDLGGEAHINRPNIVFSRAESDPNREHPRWDGTRIRDTVHRLILEGGISGESVVNPVVSFADDLPAVYASVMDDPGSGVKMGVVY